MEAISNSICPYCGGSTYGTTYCCKGCEVLARGFEPASIEISDFSFLDQPNFKKLYDMNDEAFDYQLYVEGIHCSSCVHLIESLPVHDPTILSARIDYAQSRLLLKVTEGFSLAKVLWQLSEMGYKGHFLKSSVQAVLIQKKENRIILKKIAVAGACAGNIMLFVIPVYSGLAGTWKIAFNWVSFFLFLPILFYSGTVFYKNAWAGLKLRTFNIDLPITIALISGFVLSTINLIHGRGEIYYDSTASFIFLILSARFILKRIQQNLFASFQFELNVENSRFIRLKKNNQEIICSDEIGKNDLILLSIGQVSPIDGMIESDAALVDVSVLNGEPMPRKLEPGMQILAGSKVLSNQIYIRVTEETNDTHYAKTLSQLRAGAWTKSQFVTRTDQCAQILILIVFGIAIATFLFLFNQDPQEAFNRSLALIVLACPCALALGSPLAMALAVKKSLSKGILIKNTDALEKILKIKNVFFDKTGTITEADLNLVGTSPKNLPEHLKVVMVSLEQKSYHPIAFAIRKYFSTTKIILVQELREIFGKGVSGIIGNQFYELSTDSTAANSTHVSLVLQKNGEKICSLSFENSIRPETVGAIRYLKNKNMNCFILSGDSQDRVKSIALACNIPMQQALGGLSSEEKAMILRRNKNTCMIGDGTNDALGLQAADVGIAVKGSTSINLQAADILFTRGGLTPLIDLFKTAKDARTVLVRNLVFSLVYNLIGGTLAVAGFVSPLLAAILMPVSSIVIIASTLWGLR